MLWSGRTNARWARDERPVICGDALTIASSAIAWWETEVDEATNKLDEVAMSCARWGGSFPKRWMCHTVVTVSARRPALLYIATDGAQDERTTGDRTKRFRPGSTGSDFIRPGRASPDPRKTKRTKADDPRSPLWSTDGLGGVSFVRQSGPGSMRGSTGRETACWRPPVAVDEEEKDRNGAMRGFAAWQRRCCAPRRSRFDRDCFFASHACSDFFFLHQSSS